MDKVVWGSMIIWPLSLSNLFSILLQKAICTLETIAFEQRQLIWWKLRSLGRLFQFPDRYQPLLYVFHWIWMRMCYRLLNKILIDIELCCCSQIGMKTWMPRSGFTHALIAADYDCRKTLQKSVSVDTSSIWLEYSIRIVIRWFIMLRDCEFSAWIQIESAF